MTRVILAHSHHYLVSKYWGLVNYSACYGVITSIMTKSVTMKLDDDDDDNDDDDDEGGF